MSKDVIYQSFTCNKKQRLQISDQATYSIRSFPGSSVPLTQKQFYIRALFQTLRQFSATTSPSACIFGFYPKRKSFYVPFPPKTLTQTPFFLTHHPLEAVLCQSFKRCPLKWIFKCKLYFYYPQYFTKCSLHLKLSLLHISLYLSR